MQDRIKSQIKDLRREQKKEYLRRAESQRRLESDLRNRDWSAEELERHQMAVARVWA